MNIRLVQYNAKWVVIFVSILYDDALNPLTKPATLYGQFLEGGLEGTTAEYFLGLSGRERQKGG